MIMDADAISITADMLGDIKSDSENRKPQEACGVLIGSIEGKMAKVTEVIPMANTLSSSSHFLISPNALYHLWKDMESKGKQILGAYHSHPDVDAGPSQNDVESMKNTSFVWMIVGMDGYVRAYIYDDTLKELSIEIK